MKGEAAEARTAVPAQGFAFAAATAREEMETGVETEAGCSVGPGVMAVARGGGGLGEGRGGGGMDGGAGVGLALAVAAAWKEMEVGAETEAGRGWKLGARTARAMATRLGGWPGSGWLAAVGWCGLYRRCCGRDLVPDLDIRQEHRRSHRLPCCCAAARGRGRGRALPPRPEAHGGGRPPGLTTRRWSWEAAGTGEEKMANLEGLFCIYSYHVAPHQWVWT